MTRRLPSEVKSGCSQTSTLDLPGWLGSGEEHSDEHPVQRVWGLPELTAVRRVQSCPLCAHVARLQ